MKLLVTGGAGFIGSHVVDACLAAGHDVAAVDNLFTGKVANLDPRARLYRLDIAGAEVDEVIAHERPDAILHQAARVDVRASMTQPLLFAQTNVLGSVNLLESCRRHSVRRFVYAQTGGCVYGEPVELPSPETHRIEPVEPYGVSKSVVESYLHVYQRHFGITYVVLRYPNVYGPRQDPDGEAGVVSIFAKRMLLGQEPRINGTGEQTRDYVYVGDIARANLLALTAGDNQTYNVGSGTATSVNGLYEVLADVIGYRGEASFGPPRPGEVQASCLDSRKAERDLGWRADTSLREGLRRTCAFIAGELRLSARVR